MLGHSLHPGNLELPRIWDAPIRSEFFVASRQIEQQSTEVEAV